MQSWRLKFRQHFQLLVPACIAVSIRVRHATEGETMLDQSDTLIGKLVQRLRDADPVTRRNAAGALRLHGRRAAGAIPDLSRLLADEDARVQAEARRALDRLRRAVA